MILIVQAVRANSGTEIVGASIMTEAIAIVDDAAAKKSQKKYSRPLTYAQKERERVVLKLLLPLIARRPRPLEQTHSQARPF